ncbi:MAG: ABC transporter ATP-binding protein [Phycisphaerales bacterium]|nr:ABC transporter ATP-binding protein [Phycisphaerae bacterium]NNF42661.1 ABC transporter ATP-binding protein [Phycisphaerales bacterium]NNM25726.1 ABC transporter ATP-binding protein [Phycisphaerales bacterium]
MIQNASVPIPAARTPSPPILELAGVEKVYGTERNPLVVLHGIDFTVNEGEYVAIVGPSGAGKSTLLNILGCLDRPSRGAYRLLGENVATLDDHGLSQIRRRRIGFVFQSFQLVPHLTVQENVEMPMFYARQSRRSRRRKAGALIERVGLAHRTTHRPNELSGGENQRVAIARALANDPAMVLADEPTGNLDSATSREIMRLFDDLHESGRTIVLITHDESIAATAPRRVSLRDGRIEGDEFAEEHARVPA